MCSVARARTGCSIFSVAAVFEKGLLVLRGVVLDAQALLGGVADDLVVHVGDVHDVAHPEPALQQEAAQNVHRDKGPEVADVAVVIDRGPAGVHPHFVILQGMEFFDLAGQRVVKAQCHECRMKCDGLESSILGGHGKEGQIEPPDDLVTSAGAWFAACSR